MAVSGQSFPRPDLDRTSPAFPTGIYERFLPQMRIGTHLSDLCPDSIRAMSKTLYLISIGLLILAALLSALQGTRYIMSPVGIFQLASVLNAFLPLLIGGLVAWFLLVRFRDVWSGRADVQVRATRPVARSAQTAGKFLIAAFYVLLVIAIGFLVMARGQLGGEVAFLFGPLLRSLPVGLVLFELGNILDDEA